MILLNKEEFVKAITDVRDASQYQEKLNNFFRKNNVEGYIFQPDCTATVLRLLSQIFNDKNDLIEYFCFKLNFGKKWTPSSVVDSDGADIKLETPEDLYDNLCKGGDLKLTAMD